MVVPALLSEAMSAYVHLIRVLLIAIALVERLHYNDFMHSHAVSLKHMSFGGTVFSLTHKEARLTTSCSAFGLTIESDIKSLAQERLESACENIGRP